MKNTNPSLNNFNIKSIDKEQWKYTAIEKFDFNYNYKNIPFQKNNNQDISTQDNNLFCSQPINKKIMITSIDKAIKNKMNKLNSNMNKMNFSNQNPFIELNKKNYKKGVFIHIDNNSNIKETITISHLVNQNLGKSFLCSRIFISIGDNVKANILFNEQIFNSCNLNTLCELYIGKNSNINFIHLSEKSKTTQVYNFSCLIDNNSTFELFPIDILGKLIKKNYCIKLNGVNSSCFIYSLNILNQSNHIDNFISIFHSANNTFSSTNHNNILSGKSKGIFYAKAIIEKKIINAEAHQKNKNLMLTDNATIHSNPQLEIYNNDVKCSHASTTGKIDSDALFYMQSRGINLQECKKLILLGFANEITHKMKTEKELIKMKIEDWIKSVY